MKINTGSLFVYKCALFFFINKNVITLDCYDKVERKNFLMILIRSYFGFYTIVQNIYVHVIHGYVTYITSYPYPFQNRYIVPLFDQLQNRRDTELTVFFVRIYFAMQYVRLV